MKQIFAGVLVLFCLFTMTSCTNNKSYLNADTFGEDFRAEIRFEILADDEDHLAEAAADGVEDRIVHDRLAAGAEPVELFETAVARAHACGQYE